MIGSAQFVLLVIVTCSHSKIPDYIHICKANDPNISNCIFNSVNHLKGILGKGIRELNLPPFEPLHLGDIQLKNGPQSDQVYANITEIKSYGVSNFILTELKANITRHKFLFKVKLPSLYFVGKYKIDMQILFIRLKGEGPISGNLTDYEFEAVLKGNKINQGGEEYLKFDKMKLRIKVGTVNMRLENLFNGDPVLGDTTNMVINQNSDLFWKEIQPSLESSIADRCTEIANGITLHFPYKEILP